MTTWNDVQPGDWVRGRDGALWAVADRRSTGVATARFTMSRKGQPDFVVSSPLSAPGPEIVKTADDMQDAAIAVATEGLGAVMVGVESDGIYACPPEYQEPGALLAHLHILHGNLERAEEPQTLSVLEALHAAQHKSPGSGHLPHHHTPDFLGRNR